MDKHQYIVRVQVGKEEDVKLFSCFGPVNREQAEGMMERVPAGIPVAMSPLHDEGEFFNIKWPEDD